MDKYNCVICGTELDITLTQIGIVLDGKLESVCMMCEGQISSYIKETGKKVGKIEDVLPKKLYDLGKTY